MTDDQSLTDLLSQLSETHRIESQVLGFTEIENDSQVAEAARAKGRSEGYRNASQLVAENGEEQHSLHDYSTISTSKLVNHPDATYMELERPADERERWEESVLCRSVNAIDDQTIMVQLIVDLPEEL